MDEIPVAHVPVQVTGVHTVWVWGQSQMEHIPLLEDVLVHELGQGVAEQKEQ